MILPHLILLTCSDHFKNFILLIRNSFCFLVLVKQPSLLSLLLFILSILESIYIFLAIKVHFNHSYRFQTVIRILSLLSWIILGILCGSNIPLLLEMWLAVCVDVCVWMCLCLCIFLVKKDTNINSILFPQLLQNKWKYQKNIKRTSNLWTEQCKTKENVAINSM